MKAASHTLPFVSLVLSFLISGVLSGRAETPAGWPTNLTAGIQSAREKNQPLLLYFTASWCGPCKLMARTTFTNDSVLEALGKVSRVVIDIDENNRLAEERGVRAVPTFKLLTYEGVEVANAVGYRDAEQFVDWLTNSVATLHETVARERVHRKALAVVDGLIREGGVENHRKAAGELFDLCAERDASLQQEAVKRLGTIADQDAAVLLDGLKHPRLAARIEVANLLRRKLGDGFDIDPWSDESTRASVVETWQAKLSSVPAATLQRNP